MDIKTLLIIVGAVTFSIVIAILLDSSRDIFLELKLIARKLYSLKKD